MGWYERKGFIPVLRERTFTFSVLYFFVLLNLGSPYFHFTVEVVPMYSPLTTRVYVFLVIVILTP